MKNIKRNNISEMINNYKNLSEPVKASGAYMVCSVLQKCILMISTPIFTRLMTTEQYGEVNLFNSWLSIVTVFASLKVAAGGFNSGLERFYAKKEEYISSLQGLATCCTVLELIIFPLIVFEIMGGVNSDNYFVPLLFVYVLFSTPVDLWMGIERYTFKYRKVVAMTLLIVILNPLLGIVMVSYAENKGAARIVSIVMVQVLAGIVTMILNWKKGKILYNKSYWKFILKINIPLIPNYLSQMVLSQSDRIMIERICGKSDVAIYGVAYTLGMIMLFVSDAANSSFIPWLYRKISKGEFENIHKYTNIIVVMVGMAMLIPMLFAPELIYILGGEKYSAGVWIVPSVALAAFFVFVYGLFSNIQFYYAESIKTAIGSCVAATVNIGLNIVFIKRFGFMAAGYTTAVSYFLLVIFHYYFMKSVLNKNQVQERVYDVKKIFMFCMLEMLISGMALVSYSHMLLRYSLIVVLLIVLFCNRNRFIELLGLKNNRSKKLKQTDNI